MAAVTLPPEIIALIVGYLARGPLTAKRSSAKPVRPSKGTDYLGRPPRNQLAPYASISRAWQASVERLTFCWLVLTTERIQTALANPALLTPRRMAAVRLVDVTVVLPDYDVAARARVETDAERAANNAIFTETIHGLFRLLARGVAAGAFGPEADVELNVKALSPGDNAGDRYRIRDMAYRRRTRLPEAGDLREARYISSFLEFVDGDGDGSGGREELPLLPMITEFPCHPPFWKRNIAPAACARIAASLPRLREIDWMFNDNEKRDLAGRRARRAAFARALPRMPPSLSRVGVRMQYEVKNDLYPCPVPLLTGEEGATHDPLSAALGRWARRCVEFLFEGAVTLDFWAGLAGEGEEDDGNEPVLSVLNVGLSKVLLTGQRLFVLPPLGDGDDPGRFTYEEPYEGYADFLGPGDDMPEDVPANNDRVIPDPALWNPIFLACGRAVARLPQLRGLLVYVGHPEQGVCEVAYRANARTVVFASYPNEPDVGETRRMDRPLEGPNLFQPDADVVQAWREATKVQCEGAEATIQSVDITSVLCPENWDITTCV